MRSVVTLSPAELRLTGTTERPIMRLVRESGRHEGSADRKSEVDDR
jgi:hypothetical protein